MAHLLSYPLHVLQRHFVSNGGSNVKKLVDLMTNFVGQMLLRFGGIWTLENVGEQGIWHDTQGVKRSIPIRPKM